MLVLSAMFGCYVLAVRDAERLSARSVLTAIAAVNALVLLAPPLLSTDVFSYQGYAREWIMYGANPYLHGPSVIQLDPLYQLIGAKWISTPTAYGPLFTMLSGLLVHGVAHSGGVWSAIGAGALAYKLLAAIAALGTVALLWNAARLRGLNPVRAVALFGLNPLVVVYGVGGGHNDLLMLLAGTAGVYALLAHRERSSGALFVIGAAVKFTGALVLPFALASGHGLGAPKRRRSILVGAIAATVVIAALSFALFGAGLFNLFVTLRTVQGEGDWHSIPGFITSAFHLGAIGSAVGILLGLVFVWIAYRLLRRVWEGRLDWIDGAAWATLAMLVTASSVLPWYVAWLLPLVALCTDRRLWKVSLILTGVMLFTTMLGYIPHGASFLGIRLIP
jgi:alpha-1,6-mannosyltransferase